MNGYDVVIIGAGPARLMAARELNNGPVDYLIIDAKQKIGEPLRCGEITLKATFSELFSHRNYSFIKNTTSKLSFQIKDIQKIVPKRIKLSRIQPYSQGKE